MNMMTLTNKVAIVTGASSGIGRATARLFAQQGASVIVAARRQNELDSLVEEITASGGVAKALAGDVTNEDYARDLVAFTISEFGGLNIAFNNAGILGSSGSTPGTTLAQWNEVISTNLTSAFLSAKYQLPAMMDSGGSIIFTSSFVGYTIGMPQIAAYAASKAGVIGLTKSLAAEYGPIGVRVNALLPGGTNTPMADEHMSQGFNDREEAEAFVSSLHALKRIARPEEIAQSALYLASDESSFTTGSAMLVDGGMSINKT